MYPTLDDHKLDCYLCWIGGFMSEMGIMMVVGMLAGLAAMVYLTVFGGDYEDKKREEQDEIDRRNRDSRGRG